MDEDEHQSLVIRPPFGVVRRPDGKPGRRTVVYFLCFPFTRMKAAFHITFRPIVRVIRE